MPLHKGHIYLLETAMDECEDLTILVCTQSYDPIPGDLRYEWVKQMFPQAHVVHHPEPLPRDRSLPNFWELWEASIRKYCPGETYDVVFSSEAYGDRLAQELGTIHRPVDLEHKTVPVSGTDIRENPKKYWDFIPEVVQDYYESL